ncbi:MAG: hypothetical protein ACOCUL_04635 [Bacteroidota bacterium]
MLNNIEKIEKGHFNNELISEKDNALVDTLKKFTIDNIFQQREVQNLELTGESVIRGLLDHFVLDFINYKNEDSPCKKKAEKLFGLISTSLKDLMKLELKKNKLYELSDYYKLRMIVDYISGMTDNFALSLYQKLQGIKI